jgi:glucose/arabinose dehydrogenase
VLNVESPRVAAFTVDDQHMLDALATQAVIAIQEAKLLNTIEEVTAHLVGHSPDEVFALLIDRVCDLLNVEHAAIWEIERATGSKRMFAAGLRNANGLAWVPDTGALWTAVNERDELGSDLVPDYMTSVRDGGFYGWPYSYFGQNVDARVQPQRPDLVATAIKPDYALGPHTASLGLAYATSTALGEQFQRGMFVGQHGSWNRRPRSGYKVIFVPFKDGMPAGEALDVLTGFVDDARDEAHGRPVGVALDPAGALLIADDVGNVVWRVTAAR